VSETSVSGPILKESQTLVTEGKAIRSVTRRRVLGLREPPDIGPLA
jgi:hypothetical protein